MSLRFSPAVLRRGLAALLVTGCLALAGCQGGDRPASVSGKVMYYNRPVTSGVVVLVGSNGKASTPGLVRPDGTYTIQNAPAGPVQVSFDNPPPPRTGFAPGTFSAAAAEEAREATALARLYVPTPLHYKDPARSGVTLTLKKGQNDNCDINLK
jgi:hypothetical protein